ncbi:hypothetical protein N657DRAFT_567097 [Parathielavia appendiculata]|uniref:Calcium channel YVC1 n=1 Tax=Parathielavia appendiculata TaxID=2587402 RepID=A0AAN6U6U8_9PEZI|nr:hypothetical protein N657DRAFT_567097 [Parathielavia appendiculata]
MGDGPASRGPGSAPSSPETTYPSGRRTGPGVGAGRGGRVTPTTLAPLTTSTSTTTPFRHQSVRIQEPLERRPLLAQRATFPHTLDGEVYACGGSYGANDDDNNNNNPSYSSNSNHHAPHRDLPVYTTIHRIRRDIISVVEDYLSLDQLRDVRLNVSVIRPLVDKLYEQDDISIVYCLLVNRAQFLAEQAHLSNRQNVNFTRAMLCELIATRILRRFNEDNEEPGGGGRNLLVLAHILIAGFEPFQNAPEEIRREVGASTAHHRTLPALEVAILSESRIFLASTSCQKIVDAIYEGRVVYTPSSFMDLIPDRYKQRPISLYNPREGPLLNHYRLVVPRTRKYLEIMHFVVLLGLYLAFMSERDATMISDLELCFTVYACGWVLDQFATLLAHGWDVYAQNLWSFLDVTFAIIYWVYMALRVYGWWTGSVEAGQQALDVLAMGAPVLIPRLAFNLLSDNLVFLSLRSMMSDFALLSLLATWCFLGFLLSLLWLGNGSFGAATISKWMIYIWFGLDGSGIQHSIEFHQILGPSLMVTFAFLGNTLFLTILVSMLSTTFSHIVNNAPAEIQFRRAVMTLEGVKGDAIFAYPPPFNILAILIMVPLKFCVSPRWFHKIHVMSVRLINLPILLVIAFAERSSLSPHKPTPLSPAPSVAKGHPVLTKLRRRFWDRWRITSHSDISTVFEVPLPDSVLNEIAADDDLTRHLIRRQFASSSSKHSPVEHQHQPLPQPSPVLVKPGPQQQWQQPQQGGQRAGRRNSIAPFPGLRAELQGVLSESDEVTDITARLEALEGSIRRIELYLGKLVGGGAGAGAGLVSSPVSAESDGEEAVEDDSSPATEEVDRTTRRRSLSLAELNREAEEE